MSEDVVRPFERIETGNTTLRRWDPAWAEQLHEAIEASKPELAVFMPWATPEHNLQTTRNYIERSVLEWEAGQAWNFAIMDRSDQADHAGRVIGSAGLMTRMGPRVLEIGYWVHSAFAGRGLATAATCALAEVGLRMPGIERLAIKHDEANVASGRVAQKAGFRRVGVQEAEILAPGHTGVEIIWERRRHGRRLF